MPTLSPTGTLTPPSPRLSPAVLEEFVRSVGSVSTVLPDLRDFGTRVAKTAKALDSMREMFEETSLLTEAVKQLDITPHFPTNLAFSPQPLSVPYPPNPNVDPNTDVRVIDSTKAASVIQLPSKAQWSKMQCHFTDKHTLSVSYQGQHIGRYDYEKLGFGRKNMDVQKPDVQWELLHKLAMLSSYENSKLAEPTVAVLVDMLGVSETTLFKRMSRLSLKLQKTFGISDNPFLDYLPTKGYRTQFRLRSEALLRGRGQLHLSGSQILEKHTPSDTKENDWG